MELSSIEGENVGKSDEANGRTVCMRCTHVCRKESILMSFLSSNLYGSLFSFGEVDRDTYE